MTALMTFRRRSQIISVAACTAALLVLLCLAAMVFFYRMTAPSLWLDEFHHKIIAERPVSTILNIRQPGYEFVTYSHGYAIINHYSMRLFDSLEFAVRAPQALSAILSLLFVYLLARHLFSPGAGLLAMLLLIANPMYVHYTSQNRLYHISTLGFLAAYYYYLRLCDKRSVGRWIAFVLAASFLLRVNTYGVAMMGMLGPLTLVLFAFQFVPARYRPYDVTWRTLLWLLAAALAIALLFMPFTVLALRQMFSKGADAALNDAWWHAPFPLSISALLRFVTAGYPACAHTALSYLIISGGAVVGCIVFRRARALLFFGAGLLMTLLIIHVMNESKAVIEPKRFLYLIPLMYLWLAGGCALLIEAACRLVAVMTPARTRAAAWLVRCVGWLLVLRYVAAPELGSGAYQIGQDKFKERVPYKLLADVFTFQARRTDQLWWHPPKNDSWLMEQYLPKTALIWPVARDAAAVTRAEIEAALRTSSGLWLHNIDPASKGFGSNQYVRLPILWTTTYLVRPEYLSNARLRDQDEELLLKAAVSSAEYPHVDAARLLTALLLHQGAVREADAVADLIGTYRASLPACEFAAGYYEQRGNPGRALAIWQRFANLYFWKADAQLRVAGLAATSGEFSLARRYARRAALFDSACVGSDQQYKAKALWQEQQVRRAADAAEQAWMTLLQRYDARQISDAQLLAETNFFLGVFAADSNDVGQLVIALSLWARSYPVSDMPQLTAPLDACQTNAALRTHWALALRVWPPGLPGLPAFAAALEAAPNSPMRLRHLRDLRDGVCVRTWPLYVWAMPQLATTSWWNELTIPWQRVKAVGFEGMDWQRLAWFESYYQRYTGLAGVLAWWDELCAAGAVGRAQALVRQCELERAAGVTANTAARLQHNFEAVRAREIETQRAINVLRGMTNALARELLQRYMAVQDGAREQNMPR